MTPSQIEALEVLHTALLNGASQIDETIAALQEAARLSKECPLFAKQSASFQAQIEDSWLSITAHLQTHFQVLSTSLAIVLRDASDR